MKKFFPYIACLLFLAACVKVDPVVPSGGEGDDEKVMSFSARLADGGDWAPLQTKGDAKIEDLKSGGWGLYGYYTGTDNYTKPSAAAGVIFNERQVRWDNSNSVWDYSIDDDHKKEYWPMNENEKVSFFAYGPYSMYHGDDIVSVDPDNGPQVTYTASTDLTQQKDLLWATNTSGLPHRNVNLATYQDPSTNPNGTVDFHFRHAPAKVHFTINGATLPDQSGTLNAVGSPTNGTSYGSVTHSDQEAGGTFNYNYSNRTLYYAYRTKTVTTTQTYTQSISGYKILVNSVKMINFIKNGILHLDNSESYIPYWTVSGNDFLTYTFGTGDLNSTIIHPGSESAISSGWGTSVLGVDLDAQELIPAPNNYIYMVPKAADSLPKEETKNITISVTYHLIGLSKTVQFTRTTTTVSYQQARYFRHNNNTNIRYVSGNNQSDANANNAQWTDIDNLEYPTSSTFVDGNSSVVPNSTVFDYSQDNYGNGFKAEGTINSNIIGGRDYTINLYLDGRELNLTVIPQPWDLHETVYDYNSFLNPVEQSLTYDANFVYDVVDDNVYINNRMGKFYFRLGTGMYLYWQASLIGDDAFAFTDENGEYLKDDAGNYLTSVRGDISGETSYIYVKAINTASRVTNKAKLRIYLFNSENNAVVALPKDNWLFVSSTYTDGEGHLHRVQEWNVVQTAN